MKVVIIGGSGFVGTELIRTLKKNQQFELLNIDKQKSSQFQDITCIANVLDRSSLVKNLKNANLVVLLAAEHRDDVTPVSLYYDVNVQGMKNTLDAMEQNKVKRIIFTSSVAIYGLNKVNPNEETFADPFNDYGKSKWKAEQLLQEWYATRPDWNINVIRPTVIFGENNRGNVYNLLSQIASGKFLMIGKGDNKKSLSYIGNVVAFLEFLIIERTTGYDVYNYVDTPDFTTRDLVYQTGKALGKRIPPLQIPYTLALISSYGLSALSLVLRRKLPISPVRVKKFCAVTQYDAGKLISSGFISPFSIEEGLKRTLRSEFGEVNI